MSVSVIVMKHGRRAALVCTWMTILIVSVALVGWLVQSRLLSGLGSSYIPMAPNTALSFLALSMTLLLLDRPTRLAHIAAGTLSSAVVLIAFLRLMEFLFGLEIGVDRWFINPPPEKFLQIPLARMAFFTSVNFFFVGSAIFLLSMQPARRSTENLAGLLAFVSMLLGLAFCASYLMGRPLLYSSGVIPMALNTALAFLTLGSAVVLDLLVTSLDRQRAAGKTPAMEVDRKILAGFGSALAAVFVVSIISYHNTLQAINSTRLVAHSHEVLAEMQATLSTVRDVESAARGYVLTQSSELLEDFHAATQRIDGHIEHLRDLVVDNPVQLALLDSLEPLVRERIQLSTESVNLCLRQGPAAAQEIIHQGAGIAAMARISNLIEIMSTKERLLLAARREEQEADARNTILTFSLLAVLVVLILAAIHVVVHRDLVGRQRAEEELRRASEEIRDLYNNAPCGYHSLAGDGTFVAINDTELAWLGYTREEVIGRLKFTDVISAKSIPAFEKNFPEFKQRGVMNDLEVEMQRRDGSTFFVSLSSTAIKDANGNYLSSRSTMFDITPRKRAEELFRSLLESAPDAIVIVDPQGRIKLMSEQVEAMFGYRREELYGEVVETLMPHRFRQNHPRHRDAFLASPRVRPMGVGLELYGLRKDGTEFPVEITLGPLGSGDDILICAAIRDITERKEIENQIKRLNHDLERRAQELEAANKELEAFSYSVSHDLRAPLRHIDGFADLLRQHSADRLDEKGKRYLQTISRAAKQMGQLIDDLLVFSRVGRAEMVKTTVSLSVLVQEALTTVRNAEAKGRIIEWKILPLPDVQGDPSLLRQVFVNLFSNAVKYTRKRTHASIEIGSLTQGNNAEHVIYVRDNGVGFDMSYAHKLFGVFQRLHSSSEFEGTGIGLANVHRIIARHGGRTWAEGEADKGATFFLSLPA